MGTPYARGTVRYTLARRVEWASRGVSLGSRMNSSALRLARYRLSSNLRRRRGSYVALAVLLGLVGGIAMAAVAAARRTQSSFPAFLASTNPSTLIVTLSKRDGLADSAAADVQDAIARVPGVTTVRRYASLNGVVVGPDGRPDLSTIGQVDRYGSVDGLLFDQDRLTVVRGRLPDPHRPDEMVATPAAANLLRLRVGQVAAWDFVTNAQVGDKVPGGDLTHSSEEHTSE